MRNSIIYTPILEYKKESVFVQKDCQAFVAAARVNKGV